MKDKRTTTDSLPDLPDKGVSSGIVNLNGSTVNRSDLKRGHKQVGDREPSFPMPEESFSGGVLRRPGGWER